MIIGWKADRPVVVVVMKDHCGDPAPEAQLRAPRPSRAPPWLRCDWVWSVNKRRDEVSGSIDSGRLPEPLRLLPGRDAASGLASKHRCHISSHLTHWHDTNIPQVVHAPQSWRLPLFPIYCCWKWELVFLSLWVRFKGQKQQKQTTVWVNGETFSSLHKWLNHKKICTSDLK